MIIASYGATDATSSNDNYCLRIDNRSQGAALDGSLTFNSVLYSCGENTRGQMLADPAGVDSGISEEAFATDDATIGQGGEFHVVVAGAATSPTSTANPELQLLEAGVGHLSLPWSTSAINDGAPVATSAPVGADDYLGAVFSGGSDWTVGWTYGIHPDNRAQPLWIEGL